jgi:DNA invertase Pin-like site-specific DNA recombinase
MAAATSLPLEPVGGDLEEALRALEHTDAKALVAAKQDRLPQLLLDLAALIATAQTQGWALVALDCAPDPTRPAGDANTNLLA